jgi:hypothetical protein
MCTRCPVYLENVARVPKEERQSGTVCFGVSVERVNVSFWKDGLRLVALAQKGAIATSESPALCKKAHHTLQDLLKKK